MNKSKGRILIVEDDADIAALLDYTFTQDGYDTVRADNGDSALQLADEFKPDLVLLDIMLPGPDGLEILRHIRGSKALQRTAVIMLTAKGEEIDRIVGFELGADDYVIKPFSPRELLLRARSVLNPRVAARTPDMPETLSCNGLSLNLETLECLDNGRPIQLTVTEFKLLAEMMKRPGKVFSREQLLDSVWGYSFEGYARTVDTHMRRLRHKLGPAAGIIETARGAGYRVKPDCPAS